MLEGLELAARYLGATACVSGSTLVVDDGTVATLHEAVGGARSSDGDPGDVHGPALAR